MFGRKFWLRLGIISVSSLFVASLIAILVWQTVKSSLPKMITVEDYRPLLVSQVYDRNNKKIGEFFRERRILLPYDQIPKDLVHAFLAAEDDQFFKHGGLNFVAIARAALANLRAGHTVQGASTITQQVAKTLLLTPERTLLRKVREAMLALEMEKNLTKEDILYLYLNQIYFGQGAYGIEKAAQTYFRKPASQLELGEMAMLAGLPKAPSAYSPVSNPSRAKERQVYVLNRMADVGYITREVAQAEAQKPVKVYVRENFTEHAAYFLEIVRQLLVQQLGEEMVLDQGIKIYTSLDIEKQKAANAAVTRGLKDLDKRQGYRGAVRNITDPEEALKFLATEHRLRLSEFTPERTILPDGTFAEIKLDQESKSNLPPFLKLEQTVKGLVRKVDDANQYVEVEIPAGIGAIDFETMKWARKPDNKKRADLEQISKPSQALKVGDVVEVKIVGEKFEWTPPAPAKQTKGAKPPAAPDFSKHVALELDQEPVAEAALISFDQQTQDVVSLVGGYSFEKNEFNRALQAARQTGSSFKAIVYASALDKGWNPSSPILDVPVVYDETKQDDEGQQETTTWKPSNHGKTFGGELTFRSALVRSLNVPTVKIIEDVSVPWAEEYSRRLGIFSPLNKDFTLALGSSSVTLYEMTKAFSQIGRLGKRIRPLMIHKVTDTAGNVLMEKISLDMRFQKELKVLDEEFELRRKEWLAKSDEQKEAYMAQKNAKPEPYFFFSDPDQLIRPQTAYIMNSLLRGVVEDPMGTGARARALGHEVAGKTGSTSGYFDAWFIGYTAHIATGVWVGFDKETSLGVGEVGGRSALPMWVDFMKVAHTDLPQMTLPVPEGIVFANIDADSGKLASASSRNVLRQAFIEGTEPTGSSSKSEEATDFLREDLTE